MTLHENVTQTVETLKQVQEAQKTLDSRLSQVEYYVNRSYYMTCENKQRNSKGNFIISGHHVPRLKYGENLLCLVRDMIYRKYGVDIHPNEFKVIHRVPGDRILFSLFGRMPGFGFDQLINLMNSNPNPEIGIYVSIQLFEPYSDLFYIARRLKFHKLISYYRLDGNGQTFIAVNENCKAFKFSNLNQLEQLNIHIPQELYNEIYQRKLKHADHEAYAAEQNLKTAFKLRQNISSTVQGASVRQNSAFPTASDRELMVHNKTNAHLTRIQDPPPQTALQDMKCE